MYGRSYKTCFGRQSRSLWNCHGLSNKISNDYSKNHSRIYKNHQNTLIALKTIQYDISRNDKNKENAWKPASTKRVYIVRKNWKLVRPSHGEIVRCMADHVKLALRENLDYMDFHIGTNDVSSNKTPETIAKSILDLAISSKSTTCDVSISNILIRKDKHQQKAQEVNS